MGNIIMTTCRLLGCEMDRTKANLINGTIDLLRVSSFEYCKNCIGSNIVECSGTCKNCIRVKTL